MQKRLLTLIFLLHYAPGVLAQEFFADPGEPGKQKYRVTLKATGDILYDQNQEAKDQALKQYESTAAVPVYQFDTQTYAVNGKAQEMHFGQLKPSGNFTPLNDLYNYEYGGSWHYREDADNSWSTSFLYGSASDHPFDGYDVSTISATIIKRQKVKATGTVLYFLNYSNNRAFLNGIPIPGLAYVYTNEEKTEGAVLGFPFLSYWARPTQKINWSAFYLFPAVARLQGGYMIWGPLQGNIKYEWSENSFLRSGRSVREERIFYRYQKASTSLKCFLGPQTSAELEFGRTTARSMFNGKSAFDVTSDRLLLPEEWQASLSIQGTF